MRISCLAVVAGVLLAAGTAEAQVTPLRLPEGASPKPVIGTTRPADRHVAPRYHRYPAYPVAVFHLPAVLMSDGSVYANFGSGYLPVRRACRASRVFDGRGMSTSRYTQKAPAQRTASAEALPAVQAQRAAELRASYNSCYTRAGQGGLVVIR